MSRMTIQRRHLQYLNFYGKKIHHYLHHSLIHSGYPWRSLMAWVIGTLLLFNDEISSFDRRFQLRGPQKVNEEIAVVLLPPRGSPLQVLGRSNETSYWWDQESWFHLLEKILSQGPSRIGVVPFLSPTLKLKPLTPKEKSIFLHPSIIWSTLDVGQPFEPLFVNSEKTNIARSELPPDEDGIFRRLPSPQASSQILAHLAEKLSGVVVSSLPSSASRLINYRGKSNINVYTDREILGSSFPTTSFQNKIVLIGTQSIASTETLPTPLGPSEKAIVLAQIVDHLLMGRSIHRQNNIVYSISLLILLILSVLIISFYPQSVAIILLLLLSLILTSISLWAFDVFYFWIPITSSLIQILATWVIFVGYQANSIERKHWELQQGQRSLRELEQLKNNFISLFSHDLKTPVAKIQAITDKILSQQTPLIENQSKTPLIKDLQNLRRSSEELNRYIESILKIVRVESQEIKLHLEVVDINPIIEEVYDQMTPLALGKQILFERCLEPLFTLDLDPPLIQEVILNLVENAIKYTPRGGQVTISSSEIENWICVKVSDTGEGIHPQEIHRVWEKFSRGKSQSAATKGTGLGLFLVKYFVELHGGRVQLESQVGRGTCVSFYLPCRIG